MKQHVVGLPLQSAAEVEPMSKVDEPIGHITQCCVVSKPPLNSPLGPVSASWGQEGKV
jgi:hypothetical protein